MASRLQWPPTDFPAIVHGTAVSAEGRGLLLIGPSGSGKSSIALQLLSLGGAIVSDDMVRIDLCDGAPWLARPPGTPDPPRIEARGVGLIPFDAAQPVPLQLVVDLSQTETSRLPEDVMISVAGRPVRRLHKVDNPAFPAMVLQYLLKAIQ